MADHSGQRIDHYHLIRLLGTGSFGEVYLADDMHRKSRVAIKVLPQLTDSDMVGFLNEARTIRLQHPHIVQVRDFGVDNHVPFIVMDYAPNGTLRHRHPRGTRIPLSTIVPYVNQVASALQYAHDERMIHRDVKPENLLLGPANEVLVSDFGIAMIAPTSRSQSVLEMAGTVSYMAPEQIRGKPRFASDQYALAVIIFEWLSGERPFTGAPMEIATQHVLAPAPLLRDKVPGLASEVEQVILTALAKDPKDRFTHIQAFATALEQAYKEQIQRQQQQARPIVPVVSPLPLSVEKPLPSPVLKKSLPASESPIIASKPSPLPPITQANSVSPSIYIPVPSVSPQSVTPAIPGPPPLPVTTTNEPARSALGNNVKLRRSRLFYPTRILFVLLIVALVGGGSYFSIRSHNDAVNVDTSLRTASGLIDQARAAVAQDPATALSRLASARTNLLAVQNTSLSETQHAQFETLQGSFTSTVQRAITAYNQHAKIVTLPCASTTSTAITSGSMPVQAKALTTIQDTAGKNSLFYVLGDDKNLYQLTAEHTLGKKVSLGNADTAHVEAVASAGSRVLALVSFPGQASTLTYKLALLLPQPDGSLQVANTLPLGMPAGYLPKFLTAWKSNVSLVLLPQAASTSPQIVSYTLAGTGKGQHFTTPPTNTTISISKSIVSLALLNAGQKSALIFLLSDGSIQSLQLANGKSVSPSPVNVLTNSSIPAPLSVSATNFALSQQTPVPTPFPQKTGPSLSVPGATLLAGSNDGSHLYVVAAAVNGIGARLLDLKLAQGPANSTPAPASSTPEVVGGGVAAQDTSLYMDLAQQYAPDHSLLDVKSMVADPKGNGFYLLTQNGQKSATSLLVAQNTPCIP